MYPTNNLHPIIRYPLGIIAGFAASAMFVSLLLGALKLGEILAGLR
jgi:hypothetical protein